MANKGPCWEGYVQQGFKIKNGRRVPNCVPSGSANTKTRKKK